MDGFVYPLSLIIIVLLAFMFNRNNSNILMIIVLAVGAYIIYSHETGKTATDFKNEVIESIDESTKDFSRSYESEKLDSKNVK